MKVIICSRGGTVMYKNNILGQRIKSLRKEHKYTQEDVAKKLNISIAALSRYETGTFEPKSLELIVDLSTLYNVSTDYLLGKTDAKNPEIDFEKMDIGLTNKTYENLTEAQRLQIKKLISVIVETN